MSEQIKVGWDVITHGDSTVITGRYKGLTVKRTVTKLELMQAVSSARVIDRHKAAMREELEASYAARSSGR